MRGPGAPLPPPRPLTLPQSSAPLASARRALAWTLSSAASIPPTSRELALEPSQGSGIGGEVHVDPYIILGSAVVGFLVGMTGAGGGALMTPMLILVFGVQPSTAISSDLVAAVLMRPLGAAVHLRQGTVNLRLVRWMVLGSVPLAFAGAYVLHLMSHAKSAQHNIQVALGIALLIGASAMSLRYVLDRRGGQGRTGLAHSVVPRPL